MAHITENLILETFSVALQATDTAPLQGTLPGYRTFSSKCVDGDTVHYLIRAVDVVGRPTGAYEIGRGTILNNAGLYSLRRDLIVDSSASGAAVAFGAGLKYVSLASLAPTQDILRFDMQSALGLDFVGMVGLFPINSLRPGWVKANGAAISRTAYARLFAYYGTTYGAGDGSTTFNVPDYRGEFPRFFDDGRGLDNGRAIAALQGGTVLSHSHGVNDPTHAHGAYTDAQGWHQHGINSGPNNGGFGMVQGGNWVNQTSIDTGGVRSYTDGQGSHAHNVGIYGNYTGISIQAAGSAENRPRNVAVAAFIKF